MARLFVFGVGGTGSRVMNSFIMLLAAGLKPGNFDEIIPILVDPHKELKGLNDCKRLIRLYSELNSKLYRDNSEIEEGFFKTKISTLKDASSDLSLKDDIEFDEESAESFGDFINKMAIRKKSPETLDLLSLLFSKNDFNQPLKVGFKGKPHMGSMVLNALFGGRSFNAFKSIFGKDDQIFIISSTFGGTGASGFPLLIMNFRQSNKPELRKCNIGALSVSPYYKLTEEKETSDIDSNDFMTKSKSALSYYNKPEFIKLYNSIYHIADPYGQTEPYKNDEANQPNKAHLVELLGALSIIHYSENKNNGTGSVQEYCLGGDVPSVNFNNIGNSTRDYIKERLTSLHLLSKVHPIIKNDCKNISFCKSNDFNIRFFNDTFFTDQETGIETFFNEFYSQWIKELEENQRSFKPYNLKFDKKFRQLIVGDEYDSKFLDGYISKPIDISDLLNKISTTITKKEIRLLNSDFKHCQYISMCWEGALEFINTHYKIKDNGKL